MKSKPLGIFIFIVCCFCVSTIATSLARGDHGMVILGVVLVALNVHNFYRNLN